MLDKFASKSKSMRKIFREFDLDHNGVLSQDEFKKGLARMGYPPDSKEYAIIENMVFSHPLPPTPVRMSPPSSYL